MELRYHQATHMLLAGKPINTAPYLKTLAEYIAAFDTPAPLAFIYTTWTTFPLYQRVPTISESAVQLLDSFENLHSIKLPASVREWYSLDIGLPMLYVRGNWVPYEWNQPYKAFEIVGETVYERDVELLDYNLLRFIGEQQGGDWCIHLNGSDDPPVCWLKEVTGLERIYHEVEIRQDSPRFSDFVYCFLWDWLAEYQSQLHFSIVSYPPPLRRLQLEAEYYVSLNYLQSQFTEVSQRWGQAHRFEAGRMRFSIYPNPEDASRVGHGQFFADSAEWLRELIQKIWGDNPPLKKMNPNTDETDEVLASLKK